MDNINMGTGVQSAEGQTWVPATDDEMIAATDDDIAATDDETVHISQRSTHIQKRTKSTIEGIHIKRICKLLFPYVLVTVLVLTITVIVRMAIQKQTDAYCDEIYKQYKEYFIDE